MSDYKTIVESIEFVFLDKYTKSLPVNERYQSEGDLLLRFPRPEEVAA